MWATQEALTAPVVGDDSLDAVRWISRPASRTRRQAADRDSRQYFGAHSPRTVALSAAATNERLDLVFPATVQPRAQSHRDALAQDEIPRAGLQDSQHPNP